MNTFFSNNFSWGGEIGLGVGGSDNNGVTSTLVGTVGAATILTWYLNQRRRFPDNHAAGRFGNSEAPCFYFPPFSATKLLK